MSTGAEYIKNVLAAEEFPQRFTNPLRGAARGAASKATAKKKPLL